MQFKDKLIFLMKITQTSNKELAAGLAVDPSLISLLRTGRRKQPHDPERIRQMALFFATHCNADFQRNALSEMLGDTGLRAHMPTEVLANRLEEWLQGEDNFVDQLAKQFTMPATYPVRKPEPSIPLSHESDTTFYFGEEGRREVMRRVQAVMNQIETPCPILISSDDHLDWILSDYALVTQLQDDFIDVIRRGFTVHQIMPSMNFINRYTDSVRFWLPVYSSGQIKVYYYPRIRDNLYRISNIIIPGHCVRSSIAVGDSNNFITMFSTDPNIIKAYTGRFQEHLALCRPALNTFTDPHDFGPAVRETFARTGDLINLVFPLSINTISRQLLDRLIRETNDPQWRILFQMAHDDVDAFEQRLQEQSYLEISRLPTAEEIRAGSVYIGFPNPSGSAQIAYTPETYILHLENILRLMEQYDNYGFLPLDQQNSPGYNLLVNENGPALLFRSTEHPMMLEIRRPEMVQAFREHLLRIAEQAGYDGIHRTKIRMRIQELIDELREF